MSAADPAKRFASLLKRLRAEYADAVVSPIEPPPCDERATSLEGTSSPGSVGSMSGSAPPLPPAPLPPGPIHPFVADPLVHELIYSMLLWEATSAQAKSAFKRLREALVDYNELRVCLASEIAELLGEKYPLALERSERLRVSLSDLYKRRHRLELSHLLGGGKREGREFLGALEGVPVFVMARVCLIHLEAHGIPLDVRLFELLAKERAIDVSEGTGSAGLADASSWLDRQVHAGEAPAVHAVLQAWCDENGHAPKRDRATIKTPASALIASECAAGRIVTPVKRASKDPRRVKAPAQTERDARKRGRPND